MLIFRLRHHKGLTTRYSFNMEMILKIVITITFHIFSFLIYFFVLFVLFASVKAAIGITWFFRKIEIVYIIMIIVY